MTMTHGSPIWARDSKPFVLRKRIDASPLRRGRRGLVNRDRKPLPGFPDLRLQAQNQPASRRILLIQASQPQPRALVTKIGGGGSLANVEKYRLALPLPSGIRKLLLADSQGFAKIINASGWNISCSKRHFSVSIMLHTSKNFNASVIAVSDSNSNKRTDRPRANRQANLQAASRHRHTNHQQR
jgi:hypothetical protein